MGRLISRHLVDQSLVRVYQRRQLGENQLADAHQIALALQHAGEARQVGLEPVLFGITVGGLAQVTDHRVDIVFEFSYLALRFHLNRAR
jgi:hypothetical protein